MVVDTKERMEVIKIGFEDVETWPDYCLRETRNCIQCNLQGKIACHPRFRKGLRPVTEESSIDGLLKEGKTPNEVQKITGAKIGTIYSHGQKLRRKGELSRLFEPHTEEQNLAIIRYVCEHLDDEYKDIGVLFNVEPSYISRICNRVGIHRRKSLEEKKEALDQKAIDIIKRNPRRSIASIADEFGMASTTLINRLRNKGVLPVDHATRLVLEAIRGEVIAAVLEAFAILRSEPVKRSQTLAHIDKTIKMILTDEQMAIECLKCENVGMINGMLRCKTQDCKHGYTL